MYRRQVRRRRAILVALVVASLVLLSISFSEAESGPLHSVQKAVSSVTAPIAEGAGRALKPARDLVNWFDETFKARGENEDLEAEVRRLRADLAEAQGALHDGAQLQGLSELGGRSELAGFEPVTARVIERSPTVWYSTIGIDKGESAGVEVNDPVITGDGLAGRVTEVSRGGALVTLITDHRSAVSARVLPEGAQGVVEPEVGDPDDLLLDFIESGEKVRVGEMLVTAGWSNGRISSAYPPGIPIGRVTQASSAQERSFQRVHVRPFSDIRNLDWVQVLTGGPGRPGVPQ